MMMQRMKIPALTTLQMVEVDRLMIEEFGITLVQMMENAGRNLADLARRLLGGEVRGKRIAVFCGGGNNGGGGLVAARHLHNWGAEVLYKVIANPDRMKEIPMHQLRILQAMGLKNNGVINLEGVDLVIDALVGYGLIGDPRGPIAAWIERINASDRPILALDTPSGLDTTSGIPGNPCIRAKATLTLALPKTGLLTQQARPYIGELYLADISVPAKLYAAPSLGLSVGKLFANDTIIRIEE
jgi:NAD(P)H-hydrate epimerase